jgi:hypothetical protein
MFFPEFAILIKNTFPAQGISGFADFPAMLYEVEMKRVNQILR